MSGETLATPSGFTVDTAVAFLQVQHDALSHLLDERYAAQRRAIDVAFHSQQLAMETALSAAALAVQTALTSAEKATTKAELASNERFAAVNEFRGQLADQASTFLSRIEAEARFVGLGEKFDGQVVRADQAHTDLTHRISELGARMDRSAGVTEGGSSQRQTQRTDTAQIVAMLGVVLLMIGTIVTVIVTVRR